MDSWKNLLSFDSFLQTDHRYRGFAQNSLARKVAEFIAEPESIFKMIRATEEDKPALLGIVKELEEKFKEQSEFDLQKAAVKQYIGAYIKYVLGFFGYVPVRQKYMPANSSEFFKSASVYKKDESNPPKLEIKTEIKIVEVNIPE